MKNIAQILQKYRQAEWRIQRQWIGVVLLGLVVTIMVAAAYLNVTSRAALAGREIQTIKEDIILNEFTNADLRTELAQLTSYEILESRAIRLGFQPLSHEEITYVVVDGYVPKPAFSISTEERRITGPIILPTYTESLLDWLARQILSSSTNNGDGR